MVRPMVSAAVGVAILAVLLAAPASAYEAKDSDAFFLEITSSNIEVRGSSELLSGGSLRSGVRIGLFWTVFLELGYGTVRYDDTALVGSSKERIEFRTTGGNIGLGLLVPVREMRIGVKAARSPNNRWSEIVTDPTTENQLSAAKGDIDFDSYQAFVLLGRYFEIGARRDLIRSTNSKLENSFGPYAALNIPL